MQQQVIQDSGEITGSVHLNKQVTVDTEIGGALFIHYKMFDEKGGAAESIPEF